ncbi:ATP-binding protein [Amycolatopsis methanolica]|uniref:histidine kinase n=1 Tax=Amycolatopsis methanolica 239 TaxID=1068978 RepID=A0A076MVI6_AMYME|nr:sensor histidine kinase [Amycolatopsis methanolica]AIJ22750.1 two-component system histidine kinase [Amycolatopsis methanolica 239]
MRITSRRWSLARQLLLLQVAGVAVLVAVGALLAYFDAARAVDARAQDKVVAIASTLADSPTVLSALRLPAPSTELQPFAEQVRRDTGVDFITIMDPGGIRYTHPNPELIGQRFLGTIDVARQGRVYTETYTGTLGPSMRAVVPVFDPERRVVALVSAGIKVDAISAALAQRIWTLAAVAGAALVVGVAGSYLVSSRLRRQTRGLAPAELSSIFAYYEATLHAVREGLVLVGADERVVLCNDAARDLLGLGADPTGRAVTELGLPPSLVGALRGQEPRRDEIHLTDVRVLVVSTAPVRSRARAKDHGTVVTLRDHTDLQLLTGELTTARGLAESLRSQAHEAANRLHTVVSLVEMGRTQEAIEFATAELEIAQRLTDQVVGAVSEPVLAALLLGKTAEASERGAELVLTDDTAIEDTDTGIEPRDLITVLGNLIDNAIDAAIEAAGERPERPRVTVTAKIEGEELLLRVADNGRGVPDEARRRVFERGWTTKPDGHGLGLALVGQVVRRNGGRVDVASGEGAVFTVRLPVRQEVPR